MKTAPDDGKPVRLRRRPWAVERFVGSAAEFHARPMPEPVDRRLWVLEVDRPALVLGSSQADVLVDLGRAAAAGVEVVRRRSGGGAVLLMPREVLWVDVLLPAGDPLWEPDIGRSMWWLGEAWTRALRRVGSLGLASELRAEVHRGPMVHTPWSSLACFAGVGPGEVVSGPTSAGPPSQWGPRKLVGISQRRTRAGARFQCALYEDHDPAALPELLALDAASRSTLTAVLGVAVATAELDADDLLAALPG